MFKLYKRHRWSGSHKIRVEPDADSKRGNPYHTCSVCKQRIRRNEIPDSLCPKAPADDRPPSAAKRRKLWEAWSTEAKQDAKDRAAKARKKQDSQDAAVETCALKKHSATPTTVTRPSCFGGLPRFPVAEGEHSDVWWKCRLPGCQFSLGPFPQSKQEQNRMYKARRSHLKVTHGVEAEPLPKGGKCSLPDRLPKQRATFDARWKFVWELQERELERLP